MRKRNLFERERPNLCCIEGWVAAAVAAAGVIGAVGSVVAGGEQASGQEAAANTQAGMFNYIAGQEQPYVQAGNQANTTLAQLLGTQAPTGAGGTAQGTNLQGGYLTQTFDPSSFENSPQYQFQLQQGQNAVRNGDTPGQGALSGATLKDLSTFNQNLASTYYGNYFNMFQQQQNNIFDRLSGIASLGQNAAGNLGNSGAQLGTGIAQAQAAAAGSNAAGLVGATNSAGNAISTISLANMLQNGGSGTPSWVTNGTGSFNPDL
jgi:hypothetical protein